MLLQANVVFAYSAGDACECVCDLRCCLQWSYSTSDKTYLFMRLPVHFVSFRLLLQGAEFLAFVAVNDVYVMRAWEEAQGAKGKVLMLSDGNGDLAASVRILSVSPPCAVVVHVLLCCTSDHMYVCRESNTYTHVCRRAGPCTRLDVLMCCWIIPR